jgi:hypothetical protein
MTRVDPNAAGLENALGSPDASDGGWQRTTRARTQTNLLWILTAAGFALPVFAYLAFVQHYAVNAVVIDQWTDVALIEKAFSGHLSFGALWAAHNENRMLFPNLIVLALAYTTHFDVRVEEFLSAVLLLGAIALLIFTHRRRSPATPLLWYCPVAILMLSWTQYENTIWGFQLAWYVVLICFIGTLALLDAEKHSGPALAAAVVIAVIGSYSSLQGLLIWPAGLILLLYRHRSWKLLMAWTLAAAATTSLYFVNLYRPQLDAYQINPFQHPVFAFKLFIFSLGNIAGKERPVTLFPVPTRDHPFLGTASPWIIAFGLIILVAALLAIVRTGFRHTERGGEPIGVSLILFGLGFAAFITAGRGLYGYASLSASRYTTLTMLVVVGSYLVVISRRSPVTVNGQVPRSSAALAPYATKARSLKKALSTASPVLPVVVVTCVVIAVVFGYRNGATGVRPLYKYDTQAAQVLHHYRSAGDRLFIVYPGQKLAVTLHLAQVAQKDGLSGFASR